MLKNGNGLSRCAAFAAAVLSVIGPAACAANPIAAPIAARPSATATNISNIPDIRAVGGHILTPTALPTLPASTPTPVPAASATPITVPEPVFEQMTGGGCCVQPFFSPDGTHILYIDKPSPEATTGIWSVPISQPLAAPELFSARVGPFNANMTYNAFLQNGRTVVERVADGKQWVIDNGGRRVLFSPDGQHLAWTVAEDAGNFDVRRGDIYLAGSDGSAPRQVATLYGGGVQAWLNDGLHMLVTGKAARTDVTSTLSILSLADGSLRALITAERLRGVALSPGSRYFLYMISQARDASQNGTYLLDITQAQPRPQRLDFFGAMRWCSPTRLYIIPVQMSAATNELWRYDATTGLSTRLIADGANPAFKIGNGDWDVSRDGRRITYFNARDHNIWLLTLPEAC